MTRRLRLEPLLPRHAALLFEGLQDPLIYEYLSDSPPASVDALRSKYTGYSSRKSPDGAEDWLNWAICLPAENAYVGYAQATVRPDRSSEIGYVLFPPFWRRGLAREAIGGMLAAVQQHHAVKVFRASVHTHHARSIQLLLALGFVQIGVKLGAEMIRGQLTDEARFELRSDT